jgi:hypothetical protein
VTSACYCDSDYQATIYRKSEHTARQPHKCYECGRTINPGERYESVFAVWDGRGETCKTCPHCLAIREWVVAHVPCSCWMHGNMLEDIGNDVEHYAHEAPGLLFGYLRRKHALEVVKGWRQARRVVSEGGGNG